MAGQAWKSVKDTVQGARDNMASGIDKDLALTHQAEALMRDHPELRKDIPNLDEAKAYLRRRQ
jgi:hypothetical protein